MLKLFKFDFSGMEDTLLKDNLQQGARPDKDAAPGKEDTTNGDLPALPPTKLLYRDAFKVLAFVNPDSTRQVASAMQRESPMVTRPLRVRMMA
jgi:hypothetical protein